MIIAIDQSLSVDAGDDDLTATDKSKEAKKKSQVDEFLEAAMSNPTRVGDHKVMYLPFASQAGTLSKQRPSSPESLTHAPGAAASDESRAGKLEFDRNSTDIAAAIRSAAGAMPPDYVPRIVLLTDGNQ